MMTFAALACLLSLAWFLQVARFWVGGSGSWTSVATTNWAASSGGSSGASAPTTSDNVFFDTNSGTGTVTLSSSPNCANLDASASSILTFTGGGSLSCNGNFTLKSGLDVSGWIGALGLIGTGLQTTTFAGNAMQFSMNVNGNGGIYTMQDDFNGQPGKTLTITIGTFDANGHKVSIGILSSSNSNTRTITMGSGTWSITGLNTTIITFAVQTGLIFNPGANPFNCNGVGTGAQTRTINFGALSESTAPHVSVSAGADSVNLAGSMMNCDFTGFGGTWTANVRTVYGNLTLSSTMTVASTANATTFKATSGTKTITTNTCSVALALTFDGVGGTWQLQDTCSCTQAVTLTNGTLDANNQTFKMLTFASNNANTRVIKMSTGTWELTSTAVATVWNTATTTGLTVTPSTSTIKISGSTTNIRTFSGGGKTFGNIWITNATSGGEVDFVGSNTFLNFKQQDATPQTIKFTATTTTTVSSWSAFGTASNLLTIGSITAAGHTLSKAGGGFICADFLSISRSTASPSSPTAFYAGTHSTDGGNNAGWSFIYCPCGGFMMAA